MISFVIPAHNEQDYLAKTLRAVHAAAASQGESYEIIVVDDGSTDATAAIAAEHGARVHSVAVRQIARARNAGAKLARGEKLFFLDADTSLNAELLHAACRALAHEAVGGGARIAFDDAPSLSARATLPLWNTISRLTRWAAGCFVFVRREAFEAVGGFNEELFAAEEIDLSVRLQRLGPFCILPQSVMTSARKLESHSVGDHLALLGRTIVSRGRNLQGREGLGLWYAVRGE